MTTVEITHDPFSLTTEVTVDRVPVTDASQICKYLKAPLQDWLDDFLPLLSAHCNDSELDITFHGLSYNYDALKQAADAYMAEHREYEITLHGDIACDQRARCGALATIAEELAGQAADDPEIQAVIDLGKEVLPLPIMIIGGDETARRELAAAIEAAKIDSPVCPLAITVMPAPENCTSKDYRAAKEAINSDDQSVVIFLVSDDKDEITNEDAKFLAQIADVRENLKGTLRKQRFVFTAETPALGEQVLKRSFAMPDAAAFPRDDNEELIAHLQRHIEEVWLVRQVREKSRRMTDKLTDISADLRDKAQKNKQVAEIDRLERCAPNVFQSCKISLTEKKGGTIANGRRIDAAFDRLAVEFSDRCFGKSLPTVAEAQANIGEFITVRLRGEIVALSRTLAADYLGEENIAVAMNENALTALRRLGCTRSLGVTDDIRARLIDAVADFPEGRAELAKIDAIKIERSGGDKSGANFYDQLAQKLSRLIAAGNNRVSGDGAAECAAQFRAALRKASKPLEDYARKFRDNLRKVAKQPASYEEYIQQALGKISAEISAEVRARADEMRKAAAISEADQKKLAFFDRLRTQAQQAAEL